MAQGARYTLPTYRAMAESFKAQASTPAFACTPALPGTDVLLRNSGWLHTPCRLTYRRRSFWSESTGARRLAQRLLAPLAPRLMQPLTPEGAEWSAGRSR